jgi:hypothetical protein
MLVIRRVQLDAFSQKKKDRFVDRILEHLQSKYPESLENLSRQTIRERIHVGLKKARQYGFASKRDLSVFVSLMFTIAPNFDQQSLIQECLTDEEVAGVNRLNLIMSICSEEDWAEARENYDEAAWKS